MSKTILIMAGGTGGHIFPAIAVADYLQERGWSIVWLGTRSGMEARLIPPKGYLTTWITFSGLRRGGVFKWLALPFFLFVAFIQSTSALFRFRPDVVLGMGGFAAFPGGLMASLFNKPLLLHEQNSIAGLTNRVLSGVADKILVAFPNAFANTLSSNFTCLLNRIFKPQEKLSWCGNPVRSEIAAINAPEIRFAKRKGKLKVLVVGGSLGAQALNEVVPEALARIPENDRPTVLHQTGSKHLEYVRTAYQRLGVSAHAVPFLEDMATRYGECDLLVCRAGALTIAEISAVGVASVLVPYPHAVDDHQTHNARFLSEQGAAILIPQAEFNPARLAQLIVSFSREKSLEMAKRARTLAKPEATRLVAEACMECAR